MSDEELAVHLADLITALADVRGLFPAHSLAVAGISAAATLVSGTPAPPPVTVHTTDTTVTVRAHLGVAGDTSAIVTATAVYNAIADEVRQHRPDRLIEVRIGHIW